jgi:hypothetical protein
MDMNLAFVGFFIAGVVFMVYASSFYSLAGKKLPVFLRSYALAYFCLGLAFLIWAFAAINTGFLNSSVMVGDVLLLLGSIFLLAVLFNQNKNLKIFSVVMGIILAAVFIWLRMTYYLPMPLMSNGILVFNTQKVITVILSLIFILIWLPTNILVGKKVGANIPIEGISFVYSFIYGVSTIAAIFFISFKTVPMVVISFVTLGICFIMLLYSNYVLSKLLPNKV